MTEFERGQAYMRERAAEMMHSGVRHDIHSGDGQCAACEGGCRISALRLHKRALPVTRFRVKGERKT